MGRRARPSFSALAPSSSLLAIARCLATNHSAAMSKTSAVYASSPDVTRRILDEIEDQFRLPKDDLIRITSQFLEDFALGLSEYNHPMAMMYVPHYLS